MENRKQIRKKARTHGNKQKSHQEEEVHKTKALQGDQVTEGHQERANKTNYKLRVDMRKRAPI